MTPNRVMFWQIDHVWIFYMLATLSTVLFLAGVALHVLVWKKGVKSRGVPFSSDALKKSVVNIVRFFVDLSKQLFLSYHKIFL